MRPKERDTEIENIIRKYYLSQGMIFASCRECIITTVLGSCISVCLWDPSKGIGGMNHYMLPLWNGEGLPSPKYGNIAIPNLMERMIDSGCKKADLCAKVFGGAEMLSPTRHGESSVGAQNIMLAEDLLSGECIPIVSIDVGGNQGRRIQFNTSTGLVMLKRLTQSAANIISV